MQHYRVGIIGATGMVGQRFALLLKDHPWFKVTCLAASSRSAGQLYREAVGKRWAFPETPIPEYIADMVVQDASQVEAIAAQVDFVFCAVDMKKDEILALEERYARAEVPVISNNSANRMTPDVPMMIPEINGAHAEVIEAQRKRLARRRQRKPKVQAIAGAGVIDTAAGKGAGQPFITLAVGAAGLRQGGGKHAIIQTGQRQILQQMADPLATGVEAQPQRR